MKSQDKQSFNNTEQEAILEQIDFFAKNRNYTIVIMPLAYVLEYTKLPFGLILPSPSGDYSKVYGNFAKTKYRDENNNIQEIDMKEELEKWVPRLLKYKGKAATLEMLYEHEWDIRDFGNFLKKAVQVSG